MMEGQTLDTSRSFVPLRRSAQLSCDGYNCPFGTFSCCYGSTNPCCPYGGGSKCCPGGCISSDYSVCCPLDRACTSSHTVCCGALCCSKGYTCDDGLCRSHGTFPVGAIIGIAIGGVLLVVGIIVTVCCCCCCAAAAAANQHANSTTVVTSDVQVVPLMQETQVIQSYGSPQPAYVSTNANPYAPPGYQAVQGHQAPQYQPATYQNY